MGKSNQATRSWTITRIYADQAGESHFEDREIELEEWQMPGLLSQDHAVEHLAFRQGQDNQVSDFHNAPRRQYVALLEGRVEIETSGGEVRRFNAGDVLLAEDVTGKGHRTRSVGGKAFRALFITLPS